jgi:hypothetical protein
MLQDKQGMPQCAPAVDGTTPQAMSALPAQQQANFFIQFRNPEYLGQCAAAKQQHWQSLLLWQGNPSNDKVSSSSWSCSVTWHLEVVELV